MSNIICVLCETKIRNLLGRWKYEDGSFKIGDILTQYLKLPASSAQLPSKNSLFLSKYLKKMSLIFEKQIQVTEQHIDGNNHVNNVQYVHWMEEIAGEHWDSVKDKLGFPNDIWMLLDHHIQYKKQVYLGDIVKIKTYPKPPEGIRQPRKVEFYCNDQLVVDSLTLWVFVDKETQRIKRLESDWLDKL